MSPHQNKRPTDHQEEIEVIGTEETQMKEIQVEVHRSM
jgi:hypothetical protein